MAPGLLIQIPHKFFAREAAELGFTLPAPGEYGIGMVFLPVEKHQRLKTEGIIERIVSEEGLTVLGWRDTPIDGNCHRPRGPRLAALHRTDFRWPRGKGMDPDQLERKLYVVRKRAEVEVAGIDAREMPDKGMFYHPFALVAHHRLQRPAARAADREILQRTFRSGCHQRALPGAPALFHQHISHLATGASVPLCRAQRRNQYRARQRELDARAPVRSGIASCSATI